MNILCKLYKNVQINNKWYNRHNTMNRSKTSASIYIISYYINHINQLCKTSTETHG